MDFDFVYGNSAMYSFHYDYRKKVFSAREETMSYANEKLEMRFKTIRNISVSILAA